MEIFPINRVELASLVISSADIFLPVAESSFFANLLINAAFSELHSIFICVSFISMLLSDTELFAAMADICAVFADTPLLSFLLVSSSFNIAMVSEYFFVSSSFRFMSSFCSFCTPALSVSILFCSIFRAASSFSRLDIFNE